MKWTRVQKNTAVSAALIILMLLLLACGVSKKEPEPAAVIPPTTEVPPAVAVSTATSIPVPTLVPVNTPTAVPALPTPTLPAAEQLYLGDSTVKYGYALTPLQIADPAEPGVLFKPVAGKRLIAVEIVVANISGELLNANPLNARLIDTGGNTYDMELLGIDDYMPAISLYPGERVQGWVGYVIPEGAVPARLVMKSSLLSNQELEVKLDMPPAGHVSTPIDFVPRTEPSKLGSSIQQSGYELVANNVEDPSTPGASYESVAGYKLVSVNVTLRNVSGSTPLSVNAFSATLVDDKGFLYTCELLARDDSITLGNLAVGEQVTGWLSFTIHEDAAPAYFKYMIDGYSENYLTSGLYK